MLDKKYDFKEKEEKWMNYWEENKVYEFRKNDKPVFSIDTPPPTVSGSIHIGHIFSYTQTEMVARYKRLQGYNVFYPFGFDDNGLPTERLVEKEKGIKASQLSREEFTKLCLETTEHYEKDFKHLFQKIGVSTDWNLLYRTISPSSTKISQLSFLDLAKDEKCYHAESPSLWCHECLTSIAQAELETRTIETGFNYIKFQTEKAEEFQIATTRPELLPAIVAVFVNPNDEKNKHLIGQKAIIPLVNVTVDIIGDDKVQPDKGTGIVMSCTFGDQTDIDWWRNYHLELKNIFTNNGYIKADISNCGGLKIKQAREKIINDLDDLGVLVKSENMQHEVQVHERCGTEIEYNIIKQWFIKIMEHKADFIEMGSRINWHPEHMKSRYNEWVNNIMWDWCISRQRYFGVPFPVWYCKECGKVMLAKEEELPINPLTTSPSEKCSCGSNNFIPESDVMDTWATSSVTPLINMRYKEKENYQDILNPMGIRTNAHDIIRTWDFYTIVKNFYHFKNVPWNDVMISGFILAGKGEKVSKSKSNSKVEPLNLINDYSADVVRYWAASGRLGTDIIFSEDTLLRGRKLTNKLWNVAKFIEMHLTDYQDKDFSNFEYIDKWILAKYTEMERQYLKYMDDYEIGLTLNILEKFFWNFCDDYIEIVKHRLYRPEEFGEIPRYSGQKTVYILLSKILQNFSIFMPFLTEEIYQNIYNNEKSIHLTKITELPYEFVEELKNGDQLMSLISKVRGYKTEANVSLKTAVLKLDVELPMSLKESFDKSRKDVNATLNLKEVNIKFVENNDLKIKDVKLEM